MRIRHIDIERFRGIKALEWALPDVNLLCLIGSGDCRKTSILEAIRLCLYPSWNPTFTEFDFFNGETTHPLRVTVTLGNLGSGLLKWQKYGTHLRGWDAEKRVLREEPGEGLEEVLSIRLTVDEALEPKWTAYRPQENQCQSVTAHDRADIGAAYLGTYADRHLTWSKYSALSRITESSNISSSLLSAIRSARSALASQPTTLAEFSKAAEEVEKIARQLAVPVSAEGAYKPQMDTSAVNLQVGGLALHDRDLPLRQLGLGSRRLLTLGIQQRGQSRPSIALIDELELGLEPHRVARTVQYLNETNSGQSILTTHSPVVLRELEASQLFVVSEVDSQITVRAAAEGEKKDIQGIIRKGAEAFLSNKIIVCEGATEVGLCRALDQYWQKSCNLEPMSFVGATTLNAGGGSSVKPIAIAARRLGYDVAAIVDSDSDSNFCQADQADLQRMGITVLYWEGGYAIEQFFMRWLPWPAVRDSVRVALADLDCADSVIDAVRARIPGTDLDGGIDQWSESPELRTAIGTSASKNDWFKRIDKAQEWGKQVLAHYAAMPDELSTHLNGLRKWTHDGSNAY